MGDSLERLPGRWRKTKDQTPEIAAYSAPAASEIVQPALRAAPPAVAPPAPPADAPDEGVGEMVHALSTSVARLGPAPATPPPVPPSDAADEMSDFILGRTKDEKGSNSLSRLGPAPSGAPPAPPCSADHERGWESAEEEYANTPADDAPPEHIALLHDLLQESNLAGRAEDDSAALDEGFDALDVLQPSDHCNR